MHRRLALLCLICIAGCGDNGHTVAVTQSAARPATIVGPGPIIEGSYAILGSTRTRRIYVGDSPDEVEKVYRAPTGAAEFRDLPPGFQSPYTSKGYDTPHGGFGSIFYNSRMVQATFQEQDLTLADVYKTVGQYEYEYGSASTVLNGVQVKYWFWQDNAKGQRIMICAVQDRKDSRRYDLTVSLGDVRVMDALRMGPMFAKEDRLALENPTGGQVAHPG